MSHTPTEMLAERLSGALKRERALVAERDALKAANAEMRPLLTAQLRNCLRTEVRGVNEPCGACKQNTPILVLLARLDGKETK